MQASDIMSARVFTISPGHSVWHAAQIMLGQGVSGLPVLDDQQALVGILTESDLLGRSELGVSIGDGDLQQRARAYVQSHSWKVAALMSTPVITVEGDASLSRVAGLLRHHRIKRLPVLHGRELIGIVSRKDLLRAIADGGPEGQVTGDDAVHRALRARLEEASGVLSQLPEIHVNHGVVRVSGNIQSQEEADVIRMIVDGVVGPVFLDELIVKKGHE